MSREPSGAKGEHRMGRITGLRASTAVALVAAGLGACGSDDGVGRCGAYHDTPGTARITSVGPAPANEYRCEADPVRVLFDFEPDDPARAELAATGVPLTVGAGAHPPRAWVEGSGLTVGSEHPAVRSDQPGGPCTPIVFALADVDYAAGLQACFAAAAAP